MSSRGKDQIASHKKKIDEDDISLQVKKHKDTINNNQNYNNMDNKISSLQPAVPAHVIFKLLAFTFAMIVGPIGSYYLTLNNIFYGNSTYAGATAAIAANLVLVTYIIVAFQEDQIDFPGNTQEKKKQK
ncbi:Vacuolar ATPase assembly integral membrane protein vma21 [Erysiphe necator]|nr:Vacuolar ATPase assembly integral membrane protein vma21 [Erysiphe necator]